LSATPSTAASSPLLTAGDTTNCSFAVTAKNMAAPANCGVGAFYEQDEATLLRSLQKALHLSAGLGFADIQPGDEAGFAQLNAQRKEAEQHLLVMKEHPRLIQLVLKLVIEMQRELVNNATTCSGGGSGSQIAPATRDRLSDERVHVLTSAFVYLKNAAWQLFSKNTNHDVAALREQIAKKTEFENPAVRELLMAAAGAATEGGAGAGAAAAHDGGSAAVTEETFALLIEQKNFFLQNMFDFARETFKFVCTVTPGGADLSGVCSQDVSGAPAQAASQGAGVFAAAAAGGEIKKPQANPRLLLKQLDAMVKNVAKRETLGEIVDGKPAALAPKAADILREQIVPGLAQFAGENSCLKQLKAVVGGAAGAAGGAAVREQVEALVGSQELDRLYASLLLLKAMCKSQEYTCSRQPGPLGQLVEQAFPALREISSDLVGLLEAAVAGGPAVLGTAAGAAGAAGAPAGAHPRCLWHDRFFELLRLCLKCYYHSTHSEVNLIAMENIEPWMEVAYRAMKLGVPVCYYENGVPEAVKERTKPAKCLKRTLEICYRFLGKHAKPVGSSSGSGPNGTGPKGGPGSEEDVGKLRAELADLIAKAKQGHAMKQSGMKLSKADSKELEQIDRQRDAVFGRLWLATFAVEFTKSILLCLNAEWLPQEASNRILRSLAAAAEYSVCFKFLKPEVMAVMTRVCFPLLSLSAKDAELWEEDGHEFLRAEKDLGALLHTPRGAIAMESITTSLGAFLFCARSH